MAHCVSDQGTTNTPTASRSTRIKQEATSCLWEQRATAPPTSHIIHTSRHSSIMLHMYRTGLCLTKYGVQVCMQIYLHMPNCPVYKCAQRHPHFRVVRNPSFRADSNPRGHAMVKPPNLVASTTLAARRTPNAYPSDVAVCGRVSALTHTCYGVIVPLYMLPQTHR